MGGESRKMKNFPSLLAVIGAWLCATGFVLFGIIAFLCSSLVAIYINEDHSIFTFAFFAANIVAFFRLI
jgi:hypothetical protein